MFTPSPLTGKANAFPMGATLFRCLFTVLLFSVSSARLSAQSGDAAVQGRVSNALTGNYLTNARVAEIESGKTVFTNSYGEYRISGLSAGM